MNQQSTNVYLIVLGCYSVSVPGGKHHDVGVELLGPQQMDEAYKKLFNMTVDEEQDLTRW